MYNHFATLLSNLDLTYSAPMQESYLLADELSDFLGTASGDYIALDDYYTTIKTAKTASVLVNKDFAQLELPDALKRFYDVLFPPTASDYYKQFLLYCYLRIVAASDKSNDIKTYDNRLTYKLDEITDYFRFTKISIPRGNNLNYRLLVSGKLGLSDDVKYFLNSFILKQVDNTKNVLIFSSTQLKYYKQGKPPSNNSAGMEVPFASAQNISEPLIIGDTGLVCRLSGPFDSSDPSINFSATGNKIWTFTAETPFNLDFSEKLKELTTHNVIIDDMLNYSDTSCTSVYSNMWHSHYNSVYRVAGLLLAYVERVDLVWRNIAT